MTIVERMRGQLKESMKAQDTARTSFLRYWIAQLTLGDGTFAPDETAVKKMRGVLNEAKAGITSFTPRELELIEEWVPAQLTAEQVREALAPIADGIRNAPKEGMAMGLAMKHLAGKLVDSGEVKAAVAAIRS